jgi:hypothetical protein
MASSLCCLRRRGVRPEHPEPPPVDWQNTPVSWQTKARVFAALVRFRRWSKHHTIVASRLRGGRACSGRQLGSVAARRRALALTLT